MRKWLLAGLGLLLMVGVSTLIYGVSAELDRDLSITEKSYRFRVNEGDGLIRVVNAFESQGLIRSADWVRLALQFEVHSLVVKPGDYQIEPGESIRQLLKRMDAGDVVVYPVTIPEGVTLDWMLARLWDHPQLARVLEGPRDERILSLITPYSEPEGLFLPETYLVQAGDTDLSVLERARNAMRETLSRAWLNRAENLPFNNAYEALILASIIEKETGVARERPDIAGVFTRRLQRGMRLQTDPTIIYGLGDDFDGNLKRRHLRDDKNPYNTYRISGLPPTPIALPGEAAISAALNPSPGSVLYFVAKGDGSHVFSETLSEHEKNVRRYQLQRKKDYRSSPR
ncbi:endolytic transglycosylase MltG [Luminiphilus sp.]|nr:endolytic transglycosylase MltG [Luminiphilus sp.]